MCGGHGSVAKEEEQPKFVAANVTLQSSKGEKAFSTWSYQFGIIFVKRLQNNWWYGH